MAQRKSERIVNLTICLLSTRRLLPKSRIREIVEGYRTMSEASFERTFERDKEELRAMGVPVESGLGDVYFGDEHGYRIPRNGFELPPVEFSAAEATALGMAAQVWQTASAAEQASGALAKLRAAGIDPDPARLTALQPAVSAHEPAFEPIWAATLRRQVVQFTYRGSDETRILEPWRTLWRKGSWYVLGHDRGRGAARMFKMSRFTSVPRAVGAEGAYSVPPADELDAHARSLEPTRADSEALLAVVADRAPWLRRRGRLASAPDGVHVPDGWVVLSVPYATRGDVVADIAQAGADVVVLAPADLRERVIEHLRDVIAVHGLAAAEGGAA